MPAETPPPSLPPPDAPGSPEPRRTTAETARAIVRKLGPRGLDGLFGWTFFDPANLVCVAVLLGAGALTLISMRGRGDPDWHLALGLYGALALFLRGYFFAYYHGSAFGRVSVFLVLVVSLLWSGALWYDRAAPYEVLREGGIEHLPEAAGFQVAALLHTVAAATLMIHLILPRAWLLKVTDEIADHSGRDTAHDAPLETIDDPEERARREAALAESGDARNESERRGSERRGEDRRRSERRGS